MLATLLCEHFDLSAKDLNQIHKLGSRRRGVPCLYFTHDWRGTSKSRSQLAVERDKARFSGRKILLLIRDPRDVVVSNYFEKKYRDRTFNGDIHQFICDPVRGIQGIVEYYSVWAREWFRASDFSVLRYEDMHHNPVAEVLGALAYCGIESIPQQHIIDVVERFRFDRMKKMEHEGTFPAKSMTPGDVNDPRSYKVRSGKVGDHTSHLDPADLEYIEEVIQAKLDPWYAGYHAGSRQ